MFRMHGPAPAAADKVSLVAARRIALAALGFGEKRPVHVTKRQLLRNLDRRLREETGLHGGHWSPGPVWWTTPGFCRERVHLFFAEGLERGEASPDEGEELEIVRWPRAELAGRIHELDDAKTMLGLLLYLERNR